MSVRTDVCMPELLTGVVISEDTGFTEERVDTLRICSRSIGCVPMISNLVFFGELRLHRPIPEDFPVVPFQTNEMTFEIIETPLAIPRHQISRVARQINVITENDWTG